MVTRRTALLMLVPLALAGCMARGMTPRAVLAPEPDLPPATPGIVPLTVEQDGEISGSARR